MAIKARKVGARRSGSAARKARKGRRPARRRVHDAEVAASAGPYRDMQREYTTALWL